tara:strand:+ start:253 stop:714 length:462 start_codon:yes stop_codon:yes gene_type:complete
MEAESPLMDGGIPMPPLSVEIEKNNEESDYSHLNDENPNFIKFKDDIKVWLKIDDDIRTLSKALKDLKKQKENLNPIILGFMENNDLKHLNTNDGKIQYSRSLTTKPLNKKTLINRLGDFFKDTDKGQNVANFILDNRDKSERVRLKRTFKKN